MNSIAEFEEVTDQPIKKSTTDFMKNDETKMKEGCCMDLRTSLATSKCLTQRCKVSLCGTKAAILNKRSRKISKSIHVTHLLKHMRVVEGLLFCENFQLKKRQ